MRSISHPYSIGFKRKAVTGILATIIIFAALLSVGLGYLIFLNQTTLAANQANTNRESGIQQSSQEMLSISASLSSSNTINLAVTNKGDVPTTIVDAFVDNSNGVLQSSVIPLSNTLNIGSSTSVATGYTYTSGSTVYVSLITSRGNTFTVQYPQPSLTSTTTTTSTFSTTTTTLLGQAGISSNALVLDLVASPPAAFSCNNGCVYVTATVYNYQTQTMNSVTLNPNPPAAAICTGNVPGCTATLTACTPSGTTCNTALPHCTGPFNSNGQSDTSDTIGPYSGSGTAPYVYFICYYDANTGVVGGFATFSAQATGTITSASGTIASAEATSNAIKIGGSANVLNQGPFSANFFYFKYSSCTTTTKPCTTDPGFSGNPNTPTGPLQNGYLVSGNSYYVAYYIQVTNNFNVTLPVLQYTFFLTDPTIGSDSDFFLVGPSSNSSVYYPQYAGSTTPSLVQNTGSVYSCDPLLGGAITNCIDISPGKTVTLTLAACNYGSNSWNWASDADGANNGGGSIGCSVGSTSTHPPDYTIPEASWLGIVVFFLYKGQVYAQMIPFSGDLICDTNC